MDRRKTCNMMRAGTNAIILFFFLCLYAVSPTLKIVLLIKEEENNYEGGEQSQTPVGPHVMLTREIRIFGVRIRC